MIQQAEISGEPLYQVIARRAEEHWSRLGNVMLVVGATDIEDLARVRAAATSNVSIPAAVRARSACAAAGRAAASSGLG